MTTPTLSAPFLAARSRVAVGASRGSLALPVLVVGLTLCLAGYAALGWWMVQAFLGLFA